jgi:hypothetical protein
METVEMRATLTSLHQKLAQAMDKLKELRHNWQYIVQGNHEHCPAAKRIEQVALLSLLNELGNTRTNEQQREAMLADRLESMSVYQAAIANEHKVSLQIQEILNEIELTRLAIEIELTLARMVRHA